MQNNKILNKIDYLTVGIYFLLVFLGWLNIYSAVYNENHQSIFDISQRYGKQLLWIGAAVLIIAVIFIIDSKFYIFFSYPIYILTILLLIFVLLFGKEVNGARSWFEIGGFRLQPAEFAKFATNLAIAKLLSKFNFKLLKISNLALVSLILFTPAALILLQNDTGSALVYFSFIFVLFREGLPGMVLVVGFFIAIIFIITLILSPLSVAVIILLASITAFRLFDRSTLRAVKAGGIISLTAIALWAINLLLKKDIPDEYFVYTAFVLLIPYFLYYAFKTKKNYIYWIILITAGTLMFSLSVSYIFNNVLEEHQRDRINNLLGIEYDPLGAGYNVNQSKIAIGSGGFSGKGYLQGTQTKFDFVPEQSTDFIFCTVGEEWGFVGSTIVIALFTFLLLRLIYIAERQKSKFTRIYAYGVVSIFFFHIAVNIGMTIGLAPVIGIPLPFFSYGGSSLWSFTILLFILLKLDSNRDELLF